MLRFRGRQGAFFTMPITSANSSFRYYQQDALGSVIALLDETGTIKTRYAYEPFGNVTISGEPSDNSFQYTGRENDGTGLYYYRARHYNPQMQRFLSEDPIGLARGVNFYVYVDSVGKPRLETNLYSYAFNNPVNYIDPDGEFPWIPVIAGTLIAAEVWNHIIYPLLHPEELHQPTPHIEPEVCHPTNPRRLPPQRLPEPPKQPKPPSPPYKPVRR